MLQKKFSSHSWLFSFAFTNVQHFSDSCDFVARRYRRLDLGRRDVRRQRQQTRRHRRRRERLPSQRRQRRLLRRRLGPNPDGVEVVDGADVPQAESPAADFSVKHRRR